VKAAKSIKKPEGLAQP